MKNKPLWLLTTLLFSFISWTQAQDVTTFKLHNGFTVWLNNDDSQPKVYGAVVVKAGAKDCPNSGIAHYLEHLLFKGTKNIGTIDYDKEKPWLDSISAQYDLLPKVNAQERLVIQRHINELSIKASDYAIPNEFSNLISQYGGTSLNAYTSFDETVFHNFFSPQYFRQWCELNSERLKDPVFRLFQGELETVYEEKNMYTDNLLTHTAEKAQQYALAGTPYAYPIIGATDSLKNPSLKEMMRFFKKYYVPENMGLILCGNYSPSSPSPDPSPKVRGGSIPLDSIKKILEETFGSIKPSGRKDFVTSKAVLRDFRGQPTLKLKVPIPIVKVGGFAWQAPDEHSKDYAAFQVMTSMLINNDKTGLIDSLSNSGKLLFADGLGYSFKDFTAWGFGFVPNIFASRKKAERRSFEQINKLKRGEFSNATLEAEKLTLRRNHDMALETISGRSKAMINAFSHGLDWDDVKNRGKETEAVTKEDVMRVARKYLNDDSLKIVKKFGHYPKEHVSQPGYKPVKPVNAGKQSEYAKQLAQLHVTETEPRLIDIDKDAEHIALKPLVNLYTTPNNDIFTLKIIWRRGYRNDNRLEAIAEYLNDIGTAKHSKQEFGRLLRNIGASISVSEAKPTSVILTLTGFDKNMRKSMELLNEFLTQPKADKGKFKDLITNSKLGRRTFFKQNSNIASAVLQKVMRGDNSDYLCQLNGKELKRIGAEGLVNLFKELQQWQTDIVYSGSKNTKEVESLVRKYIPVNNVTKAWEPVKQQLQPSDNPTIYVYDNPSARQTIVGTYQRLNPMPTISDRARMSLWANYFGTGMQSVLFQEVREFRALAYSAHGSSYTPSFKLQPDGNCAYITMIGTQADKTMQTVTLVDSLLRNMPIHENNVSSTKHTIVNSINNSYPTLRNKGIEVANLRLYGYKENPNREFLNDVEKLNVDDLTQFYINNVKSQPHDMIIVGNKKTLDMTKLSKIGKIVMLKEDDVYKR